MKHEKRFNIVFNKKYNHNFKISDIHFEVDMQLLGCNAKTLWLDVYNHIIDIISARQHKQGIIVCTNFDKIDWELLEVFYKYLNLEYKNIKVKFILITENIGFFPEEITNKCDLVTLSRPTKTMYNKIIPKNIGKGTKLSEITNIKNLKTDISQLRNPCCLIGNELIRIIVDYKNLNFIELREQLYNLHTYDIDIMETLWYILTNLLENNHINQSQMLDIQNNVNKFVKLYTINYRPIFHLEKILLYLCKTINEL